MISEWKRRLEEIQGNIWEAATIAMQEAEKAGLVIPDIIQVIGDTDDKKNQNALPKLDNTKCQALLERISNFSIDVLETVKNDAERVRSSVVIENDNPNSPIDEGTVFYGWTILSSWTCVPNLINSLVEFIVEDDLHRLKAKDFGDSAPLNIEDIQPEQHCNMRDVILWLCTVINESGLSGIISNYNYRPTSAAKNLPNQSDDISVLHLCRALGILLKAEAQHAVQWCLLSTPHLYLKSERQDLVPPTVPGIVSDVPDAALEKEGVETVICVSGAGTQEVNGIYHLQGKRNGADLYVNKEHGLEIFCCDIPALAGMPVSTRWYIGSPMLKKLYYSCHSPSVTPPCTVSTLKTLNSPRPVFRASWTAGRGEAGKLPAPCLAIYPFRALNASQEQRETNASEPDNPADACEDIEGAVEGFTVVDWEGSEPRERMHGYHKQPKVKRCVENIEDYSEKTSWTPMSMDDFHTMEEENDPNNLLAKAALKWSLQETEIIGDIEAEKRSKKASTASFKKFWKERGQLQQKFEDAGQKLYDQFMEDFDVTIERLQNELTDEMRSSIPDPPSLASLSLDAMVSQIMLSRSSARQRRTTRKQKALEKKRVVSANKSLDKAHNSFEEQLETDVISQHHNAIVALDSLGAQLMENAAKDSESDVQFVFQVTFAEWEGSSGTRDRTWSLQPERLDWAGEESAPDHTVGLIHRSHVISKKLTSLMTLHGYLSELFRESTNKGHGLKTIEVPSFPDPYELGILIEQIKTKFCRNTLSFQIESTSSVNALLKSAMAMIQPYLEQVYHLMKSLEPTSKDGFETQAFKALRAFIVTTDMPHHSKNGADSQELEGLRVSLTLSKPGEKFSSKLLPAKRDETQLEIQKGRCAGCGGEVERKALGLDKNYAPCRHLGLLFCKKFCHEDQHLPIPSRIVQFWDFEPHRVCRSAARYLDVIHQLPLICISAHNPSLFETVEELRAVRFLRMQLYHLRCAIEECHCALGSTILASHLGNRPHLAAETELYSMEDLEEVRSKSLRVFLSEVVEMLALHVASGCVDCQRTGTLCGICHDRTPVFAYQIWVVTTCTTCRSLFHKSCIRSQGRNGMCPRCDESSESMFI